MQVFSFLTGIGCAGCVLYITAAVLVVELSTSGRGYLPRIWPFPSQPTSSPDLESRSRRRATGWRPYRVLHTPAPLPSNAKKQLFRNYRRAISVIARPLHSPSNLGKYASKLKSRQGEYENASNLHELGVGLIRSLADNLPKKHVRSRIGDDKTGVMM